MQIRLYAFGGKMKSELMQVPENTTPTFEMVMENPHTCYHKHFSEDPCFRTRCVFEWNGETEADGVTRVYNLIEIRKFDNAVETEVKNDVTLGALVETCDRRFGIFLGIDEFTTKICGCTQYKIGFPTGNGIFNHGEVKFVDIEARIKKESKK